jgi:hypothetical protein
MWESKEGERKTTFAESGGFEATDEFGLLFLNDDRQLKKEAVSDLLHSQN